MGILESIFGDTEPPIQKEQPEPTIDLPKDDYTAGTPVAIRRSRLEAFDRLIELNRDTPRAKTKFGQDLEESIDDIINETLSDEFEWEGIDGDLEAAQNIIDYWLEDMHTNADIGVVFVTHSAIFRLKRILQTCEIRAEHEHDPFKIPDEFIDAASFLKRLEMEHEDGDPVIVQKKRVPTRE